MLGMTAMKNELDRSLRVLRRSRLMRHAEFKHMIDMIDRYRHDSGLAGLVRKDHQQLEQLSQDGQFFRILARMLTEVTTTKGTMKQRDDLKKVYKWYMANRSGLHCLPRFGQSMRQMDSQTVLRFAPDVIAHYSSPRRPKKKERNENVVKKEDVETAIQKVPEEKTESEKEKEILNESPTPQLTRTTGLKRPMTAPPTLSSRKTSFGQMKGENFVESSFTGQFVTKNMVLKQKRPASAAGVIRMSTPDVSPYSHEQFVDIKTKLKQGKSPRPDTASSIASSVSIRMSSVDEIPLRSPKRPPVIPKGMTVAQVINPTAQITFEDDNYDATGSNPDSRSSSPVKMLHISVPTDDAKDTSSGAKSPSKDQKSANLKAWEEYKQKQSYGQDFIGRLKFYGRSGTPHGIRYSSHEDADRPELYTEDIIANYAELSEESFSKATDEDNDRITYHSLENFYKETEKYCMDPSQKTQIAPVRVHSRSSVASEPVTVYVPEELAQDVRIKSATEEQRKHPNVKFDAIVGLTDMVKETMEYDKEKLSPDPKFGHHQPAIAVSRRPSTAPDRVMSTPVPPNSDRPSSASSIASSESSSRNQRGEPVVLLPDKTDYTMHMRKEVQSPKEANLGHYINVSGKVKPDTTRYRRPESARKTLRTAGSMSGNIRPATSMQTPRERWNADKESDQNERINQAASHITTEVDSEAVARMVLINHLGSEQTRRSRGRMGIHRIGGSVPLDAELPKLPQTLQFVSFTGPARIQVKGQPDTGRLPEAPPQSPKENNSDADSVSSSRDISLDSRMMSGRSSPAFNLDETPRFEDTPRTEVQDGKVTPIAEFRLKGQAILPTNVKGQQVGDLRYSGPRSAVGNRNIDTPSDAKTIDENIQIVWDTNNAETTRDMENEREEENVGESASEEVNQVQHDEHVDGKYDEHSNDVTDENKDKDDTTDDIDSEKTKRQDNKDEVPCETSEEKPEPCDGTNGVDIEKSATQVTDGHGRGELSENQGDKDDTIAEKHKEQETGSEMLATQGAKDNITEKRETGGEGSGTQDGTDDTVAEQQKEEEEEENEEEKVKEGQDNENLDVNNSEKDVQPTDNDDKAESMREQQKDNVECESSNTEQENNKETVENQKETVEGSCCS
ncbi:uncharacterized protein LOC144438804 isoform X2 [Glandiceps talaboti]